MDKNGVRQYLSKIIARYTGQINSKESDIQSRFQANFVIIFASSLQYSQQSLGFILYSTMAGTLKELASNIVKFERFDGEIFFIGKNVFISFSLHSKWSMF